MKATITEVSPLSPEKMVTVVFDISKDKEVLVQNQAVKGEPSSIEPLIQEALKDFKEKYEASKQLSVGQVIELEG